MMKTITFNILKINRIWIEALINNSCKCKIKVSENTADAVEGSELTLLVEDISIRSKYGTDLRYDAKPQSKEKVFLKAEYNTSLVTSCRELGGVWDSSEKVWVFDAFVKDKVEELEALYCSETVAIELKAKEDVYSHTEAINFMGYIICKATGRDSGAKLADGVALVSGHATSSGSVKNWYTAIPEGSIFRLSVPKNVVDAYDGDSFEVTILETKA